MFPAHHPPNAVTSMPTAHAVFAFGSASDASDRLRGGYLWRSVADRTSSLSCSREVTLVNCPDVSGGAPDTPALLPPVPYHNSASFPGLAVSQHHVLKPTAANSLASASHSWQASHPVSHHPSYVFHQLPTPGGGGVLPSQPGVAWAVEARAASGAVSGAAAV